MGRDVIFRHLCGRAGDLIRVWRRDEKGQMGVGYAVTSVAGIFTAYQTTGYIGNQIADILGRISSTLDMVLKGLY